MENQEKNFSQDSKPLVMLEFMTENDGLIFTYEDIQLAESEGYTKGFKEGIDLGIVQGELKAIREIDVIVQEILLDINKSLKEIVTLEKEFSENFFPEVLSICFSVLQKSMPYFFQKQGKEEMTDLLKVVIGSFVVRSPIQIKISGKMHEHVLDKLQDMCSVYPETIQITNSPDLAENACAIEWTGGGAKWNLDTRYQEIEAKLQEYLKIPTP